ncbi:hypothetical protein [Dechloromonas sp.]|uniref:hypothetical protein n=1 Tax=Dechloromonas sp. TaxID=1917218 RepID=UPI00263F7C38|nr:hypothetical protein [Dechloromonas sp.]
MWGKNRIEGVTEQGERANDCEALVIKAKWRKSGGCAEKECVLTWGDLALCLKGRRCESEREVIDGRPSFAKPSIDDEEEGGDCSHRLPCPPLDLLSMWHTEIEGWMLEQAGLEQAKEDARPGLKALA